MLSFANRGLSDNFSKLASMKIAAKQIYQIYISNSVILIKNLRQPDLFIRFNRTNGEGGFTNEFPKDELKDTEPLLSYGIWGVVTIDQVLFLVFISKADEVATLNHKSIFKIHSVKFLTIRRDQYKNFEFENCWEKLERIKEYLTTGFYFSYDYSLHNKYLPTNEELSKIPNSGFSESKFVWNYRSVKDLIESKKQGYDIDLDLLDMNPRDTTKTPELSFLTPIIQGYVGSVKEHKFNLVLISRRSKYMGGTRYNDRGSDNLGNAANFVETELIMETAQLTGSHVQIRGSLPFYWEQQKGMINPKPQIHQSESVNFDVFAKNTIMLMGSMEKCVFLNLLSKVKSDEEVLTNYLERMLVMAGNRQELSGRITYTGVDFHGITKQSDFSNFNKYAFNAFTEVPESISTFSFDELLGCYTRSSVQRCIVRTNCMDCLDRTNAAQTKIGLLAVVKFLNLAKVDLLTQTNELLKALDEAENSMSIFWEGVRRLWADNGDNISKFYSGTGATTSSVTRKGEKNKFTSFIDHKFKSISRFYLNNFDDDFKQEIINTILHKETVTVRSTVALGTVYQESSHINGTLVSLFSCQKNSQLFLDEKTLEKIFTKSGDKDLIVFVSRMDQKKTIMLEGKDYMVSGSFNELLGKMFTRYHAFQLLEQLEQSKFEVSIFVNRRNPKIISYCKGMKVSLNLIGSGAGIKVSLIVNNIGVLLFGLKLESSIFNGTVMENLSKIFESYIDKVYDIVLIASYLEDSSLSLETVHPKYKISAVESSKGSKDGKFTSHLCLFGARSHETDASEISSEPFPLEEGKVCNELTILSMNFGFAINTG